MKKTEKDSMKTRFIGAIQRTFRLAPVFGCALLAFVLIATVFYQTDAAAEQSDSGYETMLRQKKRDFERYLASREKKSESEAAAAEALRNSRQAQSAKQAEIQKQYQRTMKRYSMGEIEKLDRQDEERLAKLSGKSDDERAAFRTRQNHRRQLELEIAPVDSYREFDIDMTVEPESKASHTDGKSSQLDN